MSENPLNLEEVMGKTEVQFIFPAEYGDYGIAGVRDVGVGLGSILIYDSNLPVTGVIVDIPEGMRVGGFTKGILVPLVMPDDQAYFGLVLSDLLESKGRIDP